MKRLLVLSAMVLVILIVGQSCKSSKKQVQKNIPQMPGDQIIYSTDSELPGWVLAEPENKDGFMFFRGSSEKYASRTRGEAAAVQNAREKIAAYINTGIIGKLKSKSVDASKDAAIKDPLSITKIESEAIFNESIQEMRVINRYWEQRRVADGKDYYNVWVLVSIPLENLKSSKDKILQKKIENLQEQLKQDKSQSETDEIKKQIEILKQLESLELF